MGAVGAVPGTIAAHPLDCLKVRQQTTGCCVRTAFWKTKDAGFYSGLTPALQQKVMTRGPMFLVSDLFVQLCVSQLGLGLTTASFVGSAASGYVTGGLAAMPEYRKVLRSQGVISPTTTLLHIARDAWKANGSRGLWSLRRRAHAAATRNAIFDSTFFGCKHVLQDQQGWDAPLAYGASAFTAVVLDYSVDVAVKRMMVQPPHVLLTSGVLATTLALVRKERSKVFCGLGYKSAEFSVSYVVTGAVSGSVAASFAWMSGLMPRS